MLRQAAVAIAVAGNFRSITDAQQVQMEKVVRNKAAGDIWISMTDGAVIVSQEKLIHNNSVKKPEEWSFLFLSFFFNESKNPQ